MSSVAKGLSPVKQKRIYVPLERKKEAETTIKKLVGGE